jgi:plastocyanin
MQVVSMVSEQVCNAANQDSPTRNQAWVFGPDNGVANVLVQIKSNIPTSSDPIPGEPVVFDQAGCVYTPHVFGLRTGQVLKILNPDGVTHNVNAQPSVNRSFNAGMPAFRKEMEQTFDKAEPVPFAIRCDVHPWMGAWGAVFDHPYFAVTGPDGGFSIPDLPVGTYELEIWHETAGTQTQTVTVAANTATTASFTLSAQ